MLLYKKFPFLLPNKTHIMHSLKIIHPIHVLHSYIYFYFNPLTRVGHSILFRSEHSVLFRSFKECNVLLRSFFQFLATYETQKNAKNEMFLRYEFDSVNFGKPSDMKREKSPC